MKQKKMQIDGEGVLIKLPAEQLQRAIEFYDQIAEKVRPYECFFCEDSEGKCRNCPFSSLRTGCECGLEEVWRRG